MGFIQGREPLVIQAFVTKSPIEAFDICVLHRLAKLGECQLDALGMRPSIQSQTGELRSMIDPNHCR